SLEPGRRAVAGKDHPGTRRCGQYGEEGRHYAAQVCRWSWCQWRLRATGDASWQLSAGMASAAAAPTVTWSQTAMPKTVLHASIGPDLALFDIDIADATLTKRSVVTLPANIQYAWPHPSTRYFYVVSSNGGPGTIPGDTHLASAFRVDPGSGTLAPHGQPQALPSRPIHCCVDATGAYLLTAFNFPSAATVHRINPDGTLGGPVSQPVKPDSGIFAHQIRTTPSNQSAILVTRGNNAGD